MANVKEYEGQWVVEVSPQKWLNPNGKVASVPIKMNSEQSAKEIAAKFGYEIQNSTPFQNGSAKAEAEIGMKIKNEAPFIGISFNGQTKKFTSEAEANKFTADLDKKGIDWTASYGAGWK